MRIHIVAVGKLRDKNLKLVAEKYAERLGRYLKVRVTEVRDASKSSGNDLSKALKAEGDALLAAVPSGAHMIACDERGSHRRSLELADDLQRHMTYGVGDVAFVVGGAMGLHPTVRERADRLLALSQFTFPHELARVVLLEQLYRAMTIIRGEPYHKR